MSVAGDERGVLELERRLARVSDLLARSPDPLRHPLGMTFRPFDPASHFTAWERLDDLAAAGAIHGDLVLYVHIPFCARVCSYCLLSSRPSRGRSLLVEYLQALRREMELYSTRVRRLAVGTIHLGGGTPTLLSSAELEGLLSSIRSSFRLAPDLEIGMEAHPTTTTLEKMRAAVRQGVGRVSFGVESFTPEVLAAVQRSDQSEERVTRAVAAAREAGIRQVNIDLLAGLPGETVDSFGDAIERALDLQPDSMSVNRYLAEGSPLAFFGHVPDGEDSRRVDEMLRCADRIIRERRPPTVPPEPLANPSFGTQYVWGGAGTDRPYFQQDMIGPASVLTLGHGVLGHLHGGSFYTSGAGLREWMDALAAGELPPVSIRPLGMRFERAFYFADRASRGTFDPEDFRRVFRTDVERFFGAELELLERRGLLVQDGAGHWRKPPSIHFQVTHLLSFLTADGLDDEGDHAAEEPPGHGVASRIRLEVDDVDAAVRRIETESQPDGTVLELVLCRVLLPDEAERLRRAVEKHGWRVEVRHPDPDAVLGQYGCVGEELSPSVLWCRIAMTAARTVREQERLAVLR